MNISEFTQEQKQALLDLLLVGMYADRNLASAEDERIKKILETFQFKSDYDRQQYLDAAFTRVRRHTGTFASIRSFVSTLAVQFSTAEISQKTFDILEDLLASDGNVTNEESEMLALVHDAFHL
jgi:uncharacterized tellurite resistance protein B-like protein